MLVTENVTHIILKNVISLFFPLFSNSNFLANRCFRCDNCIYDEINFVDYKWKENTCPSLTIDE